MKHITCVHHIGYLVKNLQESAEGFEALGYCRCGNIIYDPVQRADILFLKNGWGETTVELVSPQKDSDIFPLLKRYKNAPYHICYEVDDLDAATSEFKAGGYVLFRETVPAVTIAESARVAFLMGRYTGMSELVEL